MEDDLENFLRERKARLAEDKAGLQHDPPYMELKSRPQRAYGTTVKENIPPKTQAQEDESNVGLPLGLEYEKKKQKLQRELRMDYRHYITQKTQGNISEPEPLSLCNGTRLFKPSLITNVRPPSRRDAATLTEDTRGQERAPPAAGAQDRAESCIDLEPEETKRIEGQKYNTVKSGDNKTDWEKRDIQFGRRSKAATRRGDEEFATGLIIGAVNTEEVLQKKKERYRKELQEQIAEQLRNKKRERELELKVAATGANDPEKPPDRIRQFGLQRRKEAAVETDFPLVPANMKTVVDKATPAPELPRVAFQSPVLDYSSALGLGGGGLYSVNQPNGPLYPRTVDTPRISLYPPPPSSTLGDVYRSPPYEAPPALHHHHYYSRNPLEPQTPYYNHLSVPGGVHVPYWNVPPGGAVSSHYGNHSPHSQRSESSFPDPPPHPPPEVTTADSRVAPFPSDKPRSARERILNYRDALKQQIQEQQERRRVEREERQRHEAQLEEELRRHEPWGRGGGGAPLRDSTGNLIADLKRMHRLNEEAYRRPEQRRAALMRPESDPNERVNGTVSVCSEPDTSDRINGFTHVQSQFARGSVFSAPPSQQQLQEQDKYKAFLKLQIDEKMRKKAEERERMRLEEEKEEKRLAEQRERIQKEFEEEQERKRRKEQEQKAKNEELIQLAEERKREAERKKKEEEERESEALRRRQERERQLHVTEVCREPSPPIPTLQKKLGLSAVSPRPPTVESQQSLPPLSERSLSGLQSPPVPARRNQLRAAGEHHDVFSELSALRRQLRTEQKRLEGRLQQDRDWDLESPLSDRQRERPQVDVFDMARLRLQAPVRRPSSRSTEPKNLLQIHDSLQLKYNDAESRLGSGEVPKHVYRDPFNSQRSTVQGDYYDFSPTHHNDYLRSALGGPSRCSLLESESAFIEPLGEAFSALPSPEQKRAPLTARERRRLAKAQPQNGLSSAPKVDLPPHTESRRNHRNRAGAGRHGAAAGRRGNTVVVDSDDSPPPDPETVQRNTWRRMGTTDTLDGPIRRERLVT